MIPAERRKPKDRAQRARQHRGSEFERLLLEDLQAFGWARRWPAAYAGQPFDISAQIEGKAYAIECKRIQSGNLPHSCFTGNEIRNLCEFEDSGGIAVVAVYRDNPHTVRFIPWYAIRDRVMSSERGSIRLCDYPEQLLRVREVSRP